MSDVICIECRGRGFVVVGQRGRLANVQPETLTRPCYCSAGIDVRLNDANLEQIRALLDLILRAR